MKCPNKMKNRIYFNQPVLDDFFQTGNGNYADISHLSKIYELFTDFLLKFQAEAVIKEKMQNDANERSNNIRTLGNYFSKYNGLGKYAGHNSLTERDCKGRKVYEKHTTVKFRINASTLQCNLDLPSNITDYLYNLC